MKPTLNNILIERIPGSKETESGIILKSTLDQDKGKVLAIGPDVTEVNVEDTVFLNWNAATKVEGELYITPIDEVIFIY
jgi:co-chaperonin GroES (HSP10)|nr:MAG: chaperonin GroES [Caudoviricetes sp.]